MLKAKKSGSPGLISIVLEGDINQDAKFSALLGDLQGTVEIACDAVASINSVGVKEWIAYFGKVRESGVALKFTGCPGPLVYQMNLVSNFIRSNEVVSIYVPFFCEACKEEITKLFSVDELQKTHQSLPMVSCPKCAKPAVFDDLPNMYFNFLARS